MFALDSIVLYVESISASKKFYTELLGSSAQELSPTFLSFELEAGLKLELKQRAQSLPPSTTTGGGTEMCIRLHDEEALNRLFEEWRARGVGFAQPPTTLVFGRSFVALDPDGHRIRAFA
jgi:catechol 2,3-dioxygenase-like lactoylglutathione lyase family enzyme